MKAKVIKKSKELVNLIAQKELKENGIEVGVRPVTNFENIYDIIKNELQNKKDDNNITKLALIINILSEIETISYEHGGFIFAENKLKIYLSNIKNYSITSDEYLWALILSTYHETNHAITYNEDKTKRSELINFYRTLDYLALSLDNTYYKENYYNFHDEIMAEKYGTTKAKNLFKRRPHIYNKIKDYMKIDVLLNRINETNYDAQSAINHIHYMLKIKKNDLIIYGDKSAEIYFTLLYNDNRTYKNLATLFDNQEWNKVPLIIRYLIISSESYLTEVDYLNITKKELEFLLEAIDYIYNLEKIKYTKNKKLRLSVKNLNDNVSYFRIDKSALLLLLYDKEDQNINKLNYLKFQKEKVTNLLNDKKNNTKQKIRTIN